MSDILITVIITMILVSMAEMLLPNGNIRKIAISVMGIVVLAIIIAPVAAFIEGIDTNSEIEFNFYQGGEEN